MNDVPNKTVAPIVRPEGEKERERDSPSGSTTDGCPPPTS